MFARFEQRSLRQERLDTGDYTAAEYGLWLRDMRRIHGFFGELRALDNTLLAEIERRKSSEISILDVGAGSGELLKEIGHRLSNLRTTLIATDLDADALRPINSGAHRVQGSGVRLPFAENSVDHAFSTLTLHHLDNADASELLSEMGRVARERIFVVDLNRDRKAYYLFRAFSPFIFQKMTREDGALSILRSRTPDELRALAANAGLVDVTVARSALNRLVLSGKKP